MTKEKFKRMLTSLAFALSLLTYYPATSNAGDVLNSEKLLKKIEGRWSSDCANFEGLRIKNNQSIFTINSNQISINIRLIESDNNIVNIYFESPYDLGRGGANLDWSNFSKSRPIANMRLNETNDGELKWVGFYNEKGRSYQWKNQPDFYKNSGSVHFHRCND